MLSTRIPFAGFYESIWSHEIDHQQLQLLGGDRIERDSLFQEFPELEVIPFEHIDTDRIYQALWFKAFDNGVAENHIARQYTAAFVEWLRETLDVPSIEHEYEEMTSPREYNFHTDRIFVKLPQSVFELVRARLGEERVAKAFKDMFSSRSGFHSFYSNKTPAKPLDEWDHNELYALLDAWVDEELKGDSIDHHLFANCDMYEDVFEAVSNATDFGKLHEEAVEMVEEWTAEHREVDPDFVLPTPRCAYTLELPF